MRRFLLIAVCFITSSLVLLAKPNFSGSKKYHIVCSQFPSGCVTDGTTAQQNTPLFYLSPSSKDEETYWVMTEESDETFSIRNSKTGQYVTYDGVRSDSPLRRYISMTAAKDGDYSLWTFAEQEEGVYTIRNVGQQDHIWDVRTDSYCVGTYSKEGDYGSNQRFMFYDASGTLVKEAAGNTPPSTGIDVSSWLAGTTESPSGWTETGGWSSPSFGNYRNQNASVVVPFLEKWQENWWGGLADYSIEQTLTNLPEGKYSIEADIIATLQSGGIGTPATGVYFFANDQQTEASTYNERPKRYSIATNVGQDGTLNLGIRLESTTANWVAFDNLKLSFQGTDAQLIAGEKEKVRQELADYFTKSEIEELIAQAGDSFESLEQVRKLIANMPTKDPLSKALANLTIGQHGLSYVGDLDFYLYTLPLSAFGSNYETVITYDKQEGWGNLKINGIEVPSGSNYTFRSVKGEKNYTFRVAKDDGTSISRSVTFTSLPVVHLYGSFNNEYSQGTIQVQEPDRDQQEWFNMKAKWRGGITNSNGKHKRNYHVKLQDANGEKLEQKFFGLRNDNSWILESCQVDMSRIRNRILTDLWNDFSSKPYYIGQEPKAMTGSRGRFVELVLNDAYQGIYCMTENVDRKQMKLKKYDEATGEMHGQLWKSKDWSYATLMGTRPDGGYYPKDFLSTPNEYSEAWDNYNVKYPDIDDVLPTDWSVLYDAVNFVCTATNADFKRYIGEYFDLPVVIDYYILMETILATDNHGKNMFFACYDKQQDKKITFSVWDMDATSGQRWSDDYYHQSFLGPEQDYATFISNYEHGDYNLFRRLRNTNADDFNMKVRLRYRDLRQTYLATDAIIKRFENQLNEFKTNGAAQREHDRWSFDSDVAHLELNFDEEMEYLRDWFTRRMDYLDKTRFDIASLPSGIKGVQTDASSQQVAVYSLGGQKIAVATRNELKDLLHTLPAGVYIVDGRKVIVGK